MIPTNIDRRQWSGQLWTSDGTVNVNALMDLDGSDVAKIVCRFHFIKSVCPCLRCENLGESKNINYNFPKDFLDIGSAQMDRSNSKIIQIKEHT
jgi:hypothetical protein